MIEIIVPENANRKIAYVAGPYRAKTIFGVMLNIYRAWKVARKLWFLGYTVICPHANSALMYGIPEQFFLDGDIDLMLKCDIVVLQSTWWCSKGTMREIAVAEDNGISVYMFDTDLSELIHISGVEE